MMEMFANVERVVCECARRVDGRMVHCTNIATYLFVVDGCAPCPVCDECKALIEDVATRPGDA